ncbi:MAG: hypothetical protein IJ801_05320 [Lachnospiraceae bacterium]|nr:hypothetical protein [Lachnospiraceae bacterium]
MKNNFFRHFELKILSLIIAIVVWIIVANVDDYKTTKQVSGIEIEFVNGSAITGKNKVYEVPEGTTIDVVVKGRRKVVEGLTKEDFKAVADLSKMSITNAVKVEVSAVSSMVARDLTISYANDSVVVAVEDKIKKQLPVTVRTQSDVANGYAIRSKTAAPNLITVEGAESAVNLIEEVVVDVNVAGAKQSLTASSNPIFLDKSGTVLDASKYSYDTDEIEVAVEILKTKELPLKIDTTGTPKDGYAISDINYQPTSILVVGESENLANVSEIRIDDIDVTDCDADLETSVVVTDYLPEDITLAGDVQEIMIKVVVEPIEEKTLVVNPDNIDLIGQERGYSYSFGTDAKYTLRVSGLREDLDKLDIANLSPSIDVTGYGEGDYTFTLQCKELEKIQVMNTLKVRLEITQKE